MSAGFLTFPKAARLRRRFEFVRLAQSCRRYAGKLLILEITASDKPLMRLGITASRHYGNSPERNRFKRLVREAFRLVRPQLPAGYNLNVKPRTFAKNASMQDVQAELLYFIDKHLRHEKTTDSPVAAS